MRLSKLCYGGCAREIFGSAGCLGDRFANLRTAATPSCLATCCGGPLFHLEVHHVQSRPRSPLSSITTLGVVTFGDYGENEKPLFRVNSGMPIEEALEHASTLLFYSKKLAMEAAMDVRGEQYAWAAHYLCEMGKAVVDDLTQAMTPAT